MVHGVIVTLLECLFFSSKFKTKGDTFILLFLSKGMFKIKMMKGMFKMFKFKI